MKRNIFLFIFVTMIAFIALVGCKTEATNRPVEVVNHTVTFIVDGAQYGEKVTVEDGKAVAKPADPVKAEDDANTYEFKFWHLAGESAAYDFSKPIKEDTKIYATFEATAKPYDFIAFIWQGDGETIYITDLEAAQIKAVIEGAEALEGKRVLVHPVKGKTRNAFVSEVIANGQVDLVFGGANLSIKEPVEGVEYLDIDTTDSENDGHLVKLAAGWVANGSRYLGVLNTSAHKADAVAVYNLFTVQGPDYATLDHTSATLKSNETLQVTVSDTEKEVVWSSTNEEVATVQNGLITANGEGTCFIIAQVGAIEYKVEIVVDDTEYALVVWVNGMSTGTITETESERMKEAVEALVTDGKVVEWRYFTISEKEFVLQAQSADIDIVISSSNLKGSDSWEDNRHVSFHEQGPRTRLGGIAANNGWVENTSRYIGITAQVNPDHLAMALQAYQLLTNVGPDHTITCTVSELMLTVGDTQQLVVSAYGTPTFASSNANKVSVSDEGLVTALEATDEAIIIEVTDPAGNKVQISVTVSAAPIVPLYDLYIWVNLRTDKNWLSDENFTMWGQAAQVEGKTVVVERRTEATVAAVKDAQVAQAADARVDIIIGRDALGTNAGAYKSEIEAGTVVRYALDESWGYDAGYIYIMSDVATEHLALVNAYVAMMRDKVPGYFELDTTSLSLRTNSADTTLAPTLDGQPALGVEFASADTSVVSVTEAGVVSVVGMGETTITVSREFYKVTVSVQVLAAEAQPYTLVVYINANLSKDAILALYNPVKDVNCTIIFVEGAKTKVADCSAEVIAYDTNEANTNKINVIIGHNQMTSGHANGLVNATNGYTVYETRYNLDPALVSGAADNYYAAITTQTTGDAYAEAVKLCQLLVASGE